MKGVDGELVGLVSRQRVQRIVGRVRVVIFTTRTLSRMNAQQETLELQASQPATVVDHPLIPFQRKPRTH
jgi:hypothetical protein